MRDSDMENRQQHHKKELTKIILKCIPAIFMLSLIFTMSAKNAEESSKESSSVTIAIVEMASWINLIPVDIDEATLGMIDNVVREAAHFAEYFVLGVSLCLAMSSFFMGDRGKYKWLILFAIGYAISDEVHQYFVPGRCFQMLDIIIDSIGATAGILLWKMVYGRGRKS